MNIGTALAKLSGIKKSLESVLHENVSRNRSQGDVRLRANYEPALVEHYFVQAKAMIDNLRAELPDLYGDFQPTESIATTKMSMGPSDPKPDNFGRQQIERLVRDIEQIFEIRANSELRTPVPDMPVRVFITHGRAQDWRAVKDHIENEVGIKTAELAQQPNLGRTVIEKLLDTADECDCAVIVMTGDDMNDQGEAKVRENVMHEIGFFQGRYGRDRVILLHENDVNVPTNLSGVVYSAFPKSEIGACFHLLTRELKAIYKL